MHSSISRFVVGVLSLPALLLALPGVVRAQGTRLPETSILQIQAKGSTVTLDPDARKLPLMPVTKFNWKRGSRTVVKLTDPNPIIFTYASKTSSAERDDH